MGLKSSWNSFKRRVRSRFAPRRDSGLDARAISRMARGLATTHPHEIGCNACYRELGRFVESTLAGKSAAEALPLVQDHLSRCRDCREEFEALLAALTAEESGD